MGKNFSVNSQLIPTSNQALRAETNNPGEIYYTLASKVVRSEDLSEFVNKTPVLQIQSQVASTY